MSDKVSLVDFESCSWTKIFGRLFVSVGLIGFLLVAPILWAFLPFAYEYIKKSDAFIRDNPMFLVFARMTVGCVWMLVILFLLKGFSRYGRRPESRMSDVAKRIDDSFGCVKRNFQGEKGCLKNRTFWWLLTLGAAYVAARAIEMILILGYGNSVFKSTELTSSALGALKDYGYFMGLMFAVPFTFVLRTFRGTNTLTSFVFGFSTLFLVLTSGLLYVCGENPEAVRGLDFWWMTFVAIGVSCLTYLTSVCKSKGSLTSSDGASPTFWTILISSFTVNLVMSAVAALLAFMGSVCWLAAYNGCARILPGLGRLFSLYWQWELIVPLGLVVGLGATVAAPVAQLVGISVHDSRTASFAKFGVRGKDWLMICGGFEPLCVVALMGMARREELKDVSWLQQCLSADASPFSGMLMGMAVLTVLVIALLKIAEVWAEKNSVIRNAIFRDVRGSSTDKHEGVEKDDLKKRALKLALLKFYDKRDELAGLTVRLTRAKPLLELDEGLKGRGVNLGLDCENRYLVLMENAEDFFSTDDPFTAEVLRAQLLWLEKICPHASYRSLKWLLKKNRSVRVDDELWKNTIKPLAQKMLVAGSDDCERAMPFVVDAPTPEAAESFVNTWNALLDELCLSLRRGMLANQVNGLIDWFITKESKESSSKSGVVMSAGAVNGHVGSYLYGMLRAGKILLMLLGRWLVCWEAGVLIFMVALNFVLGSVFPVKYHPGCSMAEWSFKCQLDLGTAVSAFKAADGLWWIVPFWMHFSMWAIGSGVMFGAIISRSFGFYSQLKAGRFRFRRGLRGHEVLLGWDPNAVSHIRRLVAGKKSVCAFDFWTDRPQVVILSEQPAESIRESLREAFGSAVFRKWPFKAIINHGKYDSEREFDYLRLMYARAVQVTGEFREREHDSRVLITLARLDHYMGERHPGQKCRLQCHARIASPIVYHSVCEVVSDRYKNIDVSFFNFHANWAFRLWGNESVAGLGRYEALGPVGDKNGVALHVVGMGHMGIALAVQAMRKSVTVDGSFEICFVDPMVDSLRTQFEMQFADLMTKYSTCKFQFWSMSGDSLEYKKNLESTMQSDSALTVAVTMSDPGVALENALAVFRVTGKEAKILLRQDVDVSNEAALNDLVTKCYGMEHLRVFGFQDGAGFNGATEVNYV